MAKGHKKLYLYLDCDYGFPKFIHLSKLIELHILNVCILSYAKFTSINCQFFFKGEFHSTISKDRGSVLPESPKSTPRETIPV